MDERVLSTIDEVLASGKRFAIATGRTLFPSELEMLGLTSYPIYLICRNGSLILGPQREILLKRVIGKRFVSEVLEQFSELVIEFVGVDRIFIRQTQEEFVQFVRKDKTRKLEGSKEYMDSFLANCLFSQTMEEILTADILKINWRTNDLKKHQQFEAFLNEHDGTITNTPYIKGIFELTDGSVNKGSSVDFLAEKLQIGAKDIVVYGDSCNDLSMLEKYEKSYVPSNACAEAKKIAKKVIDSCDKHGVPTHIMSLLKK